MAASSTMIKNPNHVEHITPFEDDAAAAAPSSQNATLYMTLFAAWISFAAWIANFDTGYGGIVLIMPSHCRAFGQCQMAPDPRTGEMIEMCTLSAIQQSLISVTSLFIAIGGATAGVVGNYLGRRGTIQTGCLLIIIGAAGMLGTTGSFLNYMVCKCIGGVGIGQLR